MSATWYKNVGVGGTCCPPNPHTPIAALHVRTTIRLTVALARVRLAEPGY